eukprot:scaffold573914_cov45-Prasinocladus_malaysianus.AAC.1
MLRSPGSNDGAIPKPSSCIFCPESRSTAGSTRPPNRPARRHAGLSRLSRSSHLSRRLFPGRGTSARPAPIATSAMDTDTLAVLVPPITPAWGMLGVVVSLAVYGIATAVLDIIDQRKEAELREKAK